MVLDKNWHEINSLDHRQKTGNLNFIKEALPNSQSYHAWRNLEFNDLGGKTYKIDLLLLTPHGLFHVDLKSWQGSISGDELIWTLKNKGTAVDNPHILASLKSRRLYSMIKIAARDTAGTKLPSLETLIYLQDPTATVDLPQHLRQGVHCGNDRATLLDTVSPSGSAPICFNATKTRLVLRAINKIGIKPGSERTDGDTLDGDNHPNNFALLTLLDERVHWQEWLAQSSQQTGDLHRICIYPWATSPNVSRQQLARSVSRTFARLNELDHPGMLKPIGMETCALGPTLVFNPFCGEMRLDHYIAIKGDQLDGSTRLHLVRTLLDTLEFAHENQMVHCALSPASVIVLDPASSRPHLKITHWESDSCDRFRSLNHIDGLSLDRLLDQDMVYLAPETYPQADGQETAMDVFSLGAISWLIFTGKPPARNAVELNEKLRRHAGLMLSQVLGGMVVSLQEMVRWSTCPSVEKRCSLSQIRDYLEQTEEDSTKIPENTVKDRQEHATKPIINSLPREIDRLVSLLLLCKRKQDTKFLRTALGLEQDTILPYNPNDYWLSANDLAHHFSISQAAVEKCLKRNRQRWSRTISTLDRVRVDVSQILEKLHGFATSEVVCDILLARYGSAQQGQARCRWALACLRAAGVLEDAQINPSWLVRRFPNHLLLVGNKLDPEGSSLGEGRADYAQALGRVADELAQADPLPSPQLVAQCLAEVMLPKHMHCLPDDYCLHLACASSSEATFNSLGELYPRNMDAIRAIKLASDAFLGHSSLSEDQLLECVQSRYPEASPLPSGALLAETLNQLGIECDWLQELFDGEGGLKFKISKVGTNHIFNQALGVEKHNLPVGVVKLVQKHLPENPPKPLGKLLTEGFAWNLLTRHLLGWEELKPDIFCLVRWSQKDEARNRYSHAPETLHRHLLEYLRESVGSAGVGLLNAMKSSQQHPLSLGLVCDVLHHNDSDEELLRARARLADKYLRCGQSSVIELSSEAAQQWGAAAVRVLGQELVHTGASEIQLLHQADQLLTELGVIQFAHLGQISPMGLEQRLDKVALALEAADEDQLSQTIKYAEQHLFLQRVPQRMVTLNMARRLFRYLQEPQSQPTCFSEASAAYAKWGGFVDWARRFLRFDEANPALNKVYRRLAKRVNKRRSAENRHFTMLLAGWSPKPVVAAGQILIENVLEEVLAPLADWEPVLLLVLDGMSGAAFRELPKTVINDLGWLEVSQKGGPWHVCAAFPSAGSSHSSLLSGRLMTDKMIADQFIPGLLMEGSTALEKEAFAEHKALCGPSRRGKPPLLFHKEAFQGTDLTQSACAIVKDSTYRVVGLVMNHIHDSDDQSTFWHASKIAQLKSILTAAQEARRAVVFTSGRGRALEGPDPFQGNACGERWRPGDEPGKDEVLIRGSRVLSTGGSTILSAVEPSGKKKIDCQGGATPQEVVLPLAVLLPPDMTLTCWQEATSYQPDWWVLDRVMSSPMGEQQPEPKSTSRAKLTEDSVATLISEPVTTSRVDRLIFEEAPLKSGLLLEQPITALRFPNTVSDGLAELGIESVHQIIKLWAEGFFFNEEQFCKKLFVAVRSFIAAHWDIILVDGQRTLEEETLASPLKVLGFSTRGENNLARLGLKSVGDLVAYWRAQPELENIARMGNKSHLQILKGLGELLFGATPSEPLVPSHGTLLESIPALVKNWARLEGKAHLYEVVRYRYGLDGVETSTLQQIGVVRGLTRERVRQIEVTGLETLHDILVLNRPVEGRRLPQNMFDDVCVLRKKLFLAGPLFEQTILHNILREIFGKLEQGANLSFLLKLLGYEQVGITYQPPSKDWTFWRSLDYERYEFAFIAMRLAVSLLKQSEGMSLKELHLQAKQQLDHLEEADLNQAIRSCPYIVAEENYCFLTKDFVGDIKTEMFKLLRDQGQPIHRKELARLVNLRRVDGSEPLINLTSITNALSADVLFVPIGRSGLWGLAEWGHIATASTTTLMKEYFRQKGGPATAAEVLAYVLDKRPDVAARSVPTYLSGHKAFVRVGPGSYALAEWGLKEIKQHERKDGSIKKKILTQAHILLAEAPDQTMLLIDLVNGIIQATDSVEVTVRSVLSKLPYLETSLNKEKLHVQVRQVGEPGVPRTSLRERVVLAVFDFFATRCVNAMLLRELQAHIEAKTGCPPQTFYTYVNHVPDLYKEVRAGKTWCVLPANPIRTEGELEASP